jgi:uncharacterized protein
MKNDSIPNPFIYGQVLMPGKPFCARPDLEKRITAAAAHQERIVLLGERRMGKSSLVEHTLQTSDRVLISVDLRGLDSAEDFIDRVLLRLETALSTHKPVAKHLPASFKEALSHLSEVKVNLRGFLEVSAKSKPKASTVVRVMDALERASRWRPLIVFFDEFQEIAESLEVREAKHLLGVLRGEIQHHDKISYLFAGSARASMLELFTSEGSHFYQTATLLEVGPIPHADMGAFLTGQFARGGRILTSETLQAMFSLAGVSPNDQQQLAYHLWTQSTPGKLGLSALQRAVAALMAEIGRRAELILDDATPAQRKILFAVSVNERQETATDAFIRFAGFTNSGSVRSAMRPFLSGNNAILEKHGSKVQYREQFMRLWMTLKLRKVPSLLPAAAPLLAGGEHALFLPYLIEALNN